MSGSIKLHKQSSGRKSKSHKKGDKSNQSIDQTIINRNLPVVTSSCAPIAISQSNFGSSLISSSTYTITSSGNYYLRCNVKFNWTDPTNSGVIKSAIVIATSNVTLDLSTYMLSENGNGIAIGIQINPGVSNVTIKNGTIRSFKGLGIQVKGANTIYLNNLSILNNGTTVYDYLHGKSIWAGGVQLANCSNIYMTKCVVNGNSDTGLTGGGVSNLQIEDCSFDNNTAPQGACRGILFVVAKPGNPALPIVLPDFSNDCKGIFIKNSTSNGNAGRDCGFGILAINFGGGGVFSDILVEDCVFSGITNNGTVPVAPGDPAILKGILIEGLPDGSSTSNITIRNCKVFDLITQRSVATPITSTTTSQITLPSSTISVASTAGFTPAPPGKSALYLQSSNGPQTIFYSGISGNQFTGCVGGTGVVLQDTVVTLNTTTTVVSGIDLNGCSNAVIDNCTVESIGGNCLKAIGYNIASSGNNIIIKNCHASNIKSTNTSAPTTIIAAGFALANPNTNVGDAFPNAPSSGIIVDKCTASNVGLSCSSLVLPPIGTSGGNGPYKVAAGVLVNGVSGPMIKNCKFTNDSIGILIYDYNPSLQTTSGVIELNEFTNITIQDIYNCTDIEFNNESCQNEMNICFPGDDKPMIPDYIVLGGGCAGLTVAKELSDGNNKRVLVLELGNDNTNNPLVTAPFIPSPYRGDDEVELNAFNVIFDPSISSYNGAPQGAGDGLNLYPLWTANGLGGSNQHYLLDAVRGTQRLFDNLPSQIIPPVNKSTYSWVDAGGPAWNYSTIDSITTSLENFQIFNGSGAVPGQSENPSERGHTGPLRVTQLQPAPEPTTTTTSGGSLPQGTLSLASTTGFSTPGFVVVLTDSNGYQVVNFTGISGNDLTGCTDGSGSFSSGANVFLGPFTGNFMLGQLDGAFLTQASCSNAALDYVDGGAGCSQCPLVKDYNCNTSVADSQAQLNCVSLNQNFIRTDDFSFSRQGSQTVNLDPSIVSSDGLGNFYGVNGRKLVILTQCMALSAIKSNNKSASTGKYVAKGVKFLQGNSTKSVMGKNIICSMGAGYSPRFWQMSGLGPSDLLSNLGITSESTSPGVEQIGKGLHNQYGPIVQVKTSNPYFGNVAFPGQSFVQYNGNPRAFQCVIYSSGNLNPGYFGDVPADPSYNYIDFAGFVCNNRSRGGYSNTLSKTFRSQLDFSWGMFTDAPANQFTATISGNTLTIITPPPFPLLVGQAIIGTGVSQGTIITSVPSEPTPGVASTYNFVPGVYTLNIPSTITVPTVMQLNTIKVNSGLSDPNSDISIICAFFDYIYNIIKNMRIIDPDNEYFIATPPNIEADIFSLTGMERWRKLALITPYYISVGAHEAGSIVMNNDPAKGAVDGNCRLHGTLNCFQADMSIFPIQNDGNPTLLLMPIAINAAHQIDAVAL